MVEAHQAPAEERRLMGLVQRGVWSDEVDAICRVGAAIVTAITKTRCKWESFLPEKYIESAMITIVATGDEAVARRRQLSKELDMLVASFPQPKAK